jgi:hypothetical protein
MTFEIERHRNIACPRKRECVGLHELPRSGKAMRDDDGRCGCGIGMPIDSGGRGADVKRGYRQARTRPFETRYADAAQHKPNKRRKQGPNEAAQCHASGDRLKLRQRSPSCQARREARRSRCTNRLP